MRLGPQETKLLLSLEKMKMSVFTLDDSRHILKGTDPSVWNVIAGLKRKKRLLQIENGKYLLVPAKAGLEGYWSEDPWLIVPKLIDEYYVGFWTAMSFWNMTEQIPYAVFLATPKRKKNRLLEFGNRKFQFVTISRKKFFGYIESKIGKNNHFNISSKEKTIIDGLTHPEYCGGMTEVTKAIWNMREEVDWNKIHHMGRKIEINTVLQRLGYALTILGIEKNLSKKISNKVISSPYSFLDPTANKTKIANSKEFRLVLNRTKNELLDWMEH